MSTTRLLVMGVVRMFQPVHGYFVRRELVSWHAHEWAHLNPGSIYNALRTLSREAYLEEVETEAQGKRPARTTYRLTPDGEAAFLHLLREALWTVTPHDPAALLAAWGFAHTFTRGEVSAAFEHRVAWIEANGRTLEYSIQDMAHTQTPAPVAEHLRLVRARLEGEAQWLSATLVRLRAGEYSFAGEPEAPGGVQGGLSDDA
jgi:DNA-binding PadR family transcriptional regulator